MLQDHEVEKEVDLRGSGIEVMTPRGWAQVLAACQTVPMPAWRIETEIHVLECADKHLIVTHNGLTQARWVRVGDEVLTEAGRLRVTAVTELDELRPMYDLKIDSPDHIYFTEGIASHNSTGLGMSALVELNLFDSRTLYLAPLQEHVKTFADKLRDMERGSIYGPEKALAKNLRNNLYYKESEGGGSLRLMHVLDDVTKVRGQTCAHVRIDEAQDFNPDHLPEITQVQRAFPDTRSTIFAGTSKDIDTCLENQFQMGSRGIWHIRGSQKGKWWSLGDPEVVRSLLTVDGLRDPITRRMLNPQDGEFVHEDRVRLYAGRPSFHLPQLIVPEYARGESYQQIWQDFKEYSWEKFLMEVMGIPVAAGLSELTEEDLKRCCTDETFDSIWEQIKSRKRRYRYLVSGCDWGGSDYNPAAKTKSSYTVHTIYGICPDGKFDLVHAHRYAGMHYQDIAGKIVQDHLRFQAVAIGCDNGAGAYYNAYLADSGRIPRESVVIFNYTDTKMFVDRIPNDVFNLYSLHRTDSISSFIQDIRDHRVRFPRWDVSQGFLSDVLNIRRNITEAPSGRGVMRYIKPGAKADDFLQSSNFATTLGRIILGESIIPNRAVIDDIKKKLGMLATNPNLGGLFGGVFGGSVSG